MSFVHFALLGIAVVAIAAASLRISCGAVASLDARILGAVGLALGFVIAEPLLLGLVGAGASSWALTAAAVVTWLVAARAVPPPEVRAREQLHVSWSACSTTGRAAIGGLAAITAWLAAYQTMRPEIGWDGVVYHLAQPAVWITNGHPGSLHQTVSDFPTHAYPKSFEMIAFWFCAISRSMVLMGPLSTAFFLLLAVAILLGLRRLDCHPVPAALAVAAVLIVPWNLYEFGEVANDVPVLAVLAVTVVVALAATREPGALGLTIVAAGVAVGIKTTTVPVALLAIAVAGTVLFRRRELPWRQTLPFAVFGAALGSVWYVANWVQFGAPFWPFSTFPNGDPPPYLWQKFGARLLHEPSTTLHALGWRLVVRNLGGEIVILGALVLLVVIAALVRRPDTSSERRIVLWGFVVVAAQTLLWADAQFTGIAHNVAVLPESAMRYLAIAPTLGAALLAVGTRLNRLAAALGIGALAAAVAVDLAEARYQLKAPLPSLASCIAVVLIGATAAVLAGTVGRGQILARAWTAPAAAFGVALVALIPNAHFLAHYIRANPPGPQNETEVLSFLEAQPGWAHGHAPVVAGYEAAATYAGPHFTHPLHYLPADAPCSQVRAAAQTGWLIIRPQAGGLFGPLGYPLRTACLTGLTPVTVLRHGIHVYAPADLITQPGSPPGG